jgi:hypothetical protein
VSPERLAAVLVDVGSDEYPMFLGHLAAARIYNMVRAGRVE